MGCVVRAFDVRPATKEQVVAAGGEFLEVNVEEDGSGTGAKKLLYKAYTSLKPYRNMPIYMLVFLELDAIMQYI